MSDAEQPLYEMNPTGRFSDRAGDYVKYRPDYPAAAIDAILDGLGDPASLRAADVGAGTGIATRALADRGVRVTAVEPNAEMRAAAATHPLVGWRSGTGEATSLPAGSVDLVLCAQAFHWFRQPEALSEFARILVPHGRIAIMWNERDRADPAMTGYKRAIQEIGGEHPGETRDFDPSVIPASGRFEHVGLVDLPHSQRLDEEGLIGRAMSASYVPKSGERAETLIASLRRLWRQYADADGKITLRYRTSVWLAERRD